MQVAVTPTATIAPMPPARIAVLARVAAPYCTPSWRKALPVTLVVADRPCRALGIAAEQGIPAELVERTQRGPAFDRAAYGEQLVKVLRPTASTWW